MDACENHSHFGEGRVTARRRAIARAADAMPGAFTVDELSSAVRESAPGTGTATVYRAVAAMEAAGTLERVGARDGSALYVRCHADAHHHHLVCTGCGSVAHAECPLGEESVRALAGTGFTVTGHEITLYGLCPACATEHRTNPPTLATRKD